MVSDLKKFLRDLRESDEVFGSVRMIIGGDPSWIKLVKKDVKEVAINDEDASFGYFIRDNMMFIDTYGEER